VIRLEYQDLVRDLTIEYARKVIGNEVETLEIQFSKLLKYPNAKCFPFRRLIVYNDNYIQLNKSNIDALKYTVIEECAHLRYIEHNQEFYDLCIELGYDVRTPPQGICYYWKYHKICSNCGDTRFYYHKPRKVVCQKCGSDSVHMTESGL